MTTSMDNHSEGIFQRWLLMPKILYFWLSMAIYTANGLAVVYFVDNWGMKPSTVGFLMSIQGVNFIGAILWTSLVDRYGRHKYILAGATFAYAIAFALNGAPKMLGFKFSPTVELVFMCGMMAVVWLFQSALFPLLDSAMIALLSRDAKFSKDMFGNQRLFGSPAHILSVILGGFSQRFPNHKVYLYQLNAFLAATIFATLVLIGIPSDLSPVKGGHHGHGGKEDKDKKVSVQVGEVEMSKKDERNPIIRLLLDPTFMFFMLFVLSAGLLANTLTLFQSLYVKEIQKKSTFEAALTRSPACISEIAVYLSSKFMTEYLGFYWLLLFSQFAGLIRIFGYTFVTKDMTWAPYLLEITKGLNSGFIVSAGVRIASDIALPGCTTSAQGMFSGNYKGIAIMLAGILSGFILMAFEEKIRSLFIFVGCFALVTTAGFFVKFLFVDRVIGIPGFPRREKPHPHSVEHIKG